MQGQKSKVDNQKYPINTAQAVLEFHKQYVGKHYCRTKKLLCSILSSFCFESPFWDFSTFYNSKMLWSWSHGVDNESTTFPWTLKDCCHDLATRFHNFLLFGNCPFFPFYTNLLDLDIQWWFHDVPPTIWLSKPSPPP